MIIRFLLLVSLLSVPTIARGQDIVPLNAGVVGRDQLIRQIQANASILHVVAHPDDEDGAMMTYCARELGLRTILFSLTRGEGGANLISDDFFEYLGALRTLEHQKAAHYYGSEIFYSRAVDYGYSKTMAEARTQWQDGVPILKDLVEVIRREQPTLLFSRFQGNSKDGHGHHQMAGLLSQLAFDAAADPTRFPEQINRGLKPWQIQRLYVNNIRPDWRPEDRDAWTLKIPVSRFNPIIGLAYDQIARFGLGFQRSQGISGHESDPSNRVSYYRLDRTAKEESDSESANQQASVVNPNDTRQTGVLDGIEQAFSSFCAQFSTDPELLRAAKVLEQQIAQLDNLDLRSPNSAVSLAFAIRHQLRTCQKLSSSNTPLMQILERKMTLLNQLILLDSGINCSAFVATTDGNDIRFATPGQKLQVQLLLSNQGPYTVALQNIAFSKDHWIESIDFESGTLNPAVTKRFQAQIHVPDDAPPTMPAWARDSIREPFYQVAAGFQQRAMPPTPLQVECGLSIDDQSFEISCPVEFRFKDPEFGNVRYPLTLVPRVSVSCETSNGILPAHESEYQLAVDVRSESALPVSGQLSLRIPSGWESDPKYYDIDFTRPGDSIRKTFHIRSGNSPLSSATFTAVATIDDCEYDTGYRTVTARDLDRLNVFKPARHTVHRVDVQMTGNSSVGYIVGSGDEVAESLAALDVTPIFLSTSDLSRGDLSKFDVIIVGVRAYAVRNDIRRFNNRLLQFVKDGGTLIVQYQTPEFDNNFGPYPYSMGRNPEEVSEEDATVEILAPEHPLFRTPNRITQADFEGWIEQRGSKFLTSWDKRYTPMLSCHDHDQQPQRGGMLIAEYGKGTYIYSAYAWYRQLPNGIPGAYRIMANMLSLGAPQSDPE